MKWIKRIALGAMGFGIFLEVLYVAGVWLLLSTPVFQSVVRLDPRELILTLQSGWSVWPGIVHLREVRVSGEDPNVQWKVNLPKVTVHLRLRELLEKKLHFTQFVSQELDFKIHVKTEDEKRASPFFSQQESLERMLKERWRLTFDSIEHQRIARLQVEDWIYRGPATITGRLFLWPGIEAQIGPALLTLEGGDIAYLPGKGLPFQSTEKTFGKFKVFFAPFSIPHVKGSEVFDVLDASLELSANVSELDDVLNRFILRNPSVQVRRAGGELHAFLEVKKGIFQHSSRFILKSPRIGVDLGRVAIRSEYGELEGRFKTHSHGDRPQAEVVARLERYELLDRDSKKVWVQGKLVSAQVASSDLGLKGVFTNRRFRIDLQGARIQEGRKWENGAWFPKQAASFTLDQNAEVAAHVSAHESDLGRRPDEEEGRIHVSSPHLRFQVGSELFQGSFVLSAYLGPYDLKENAGRVKKLNWAFLSEKGPSKETDRKPAHDVEPQSQWWARGELKDTDFSFRNAFLTSGKMVFQCKDTKPFLRIYRDQGKLPPWKLKFLELSPVKISSNFQISNQDLELNPVQFSAGSLKGKGSLFSNSEEKLALFRLDWGFLTAGVKISDQDSEFRLFPAEEWLRRSAFELRWTHQARP